MTGPRDVDAIAWFHTIELPGGVVTPGLFDQRKVVGRLPLPATLRGKRCIDVAASDGFWSFEMARRGAAEVVSTDLDDTHQQDTQGVADQEVQGVGGAGRARAAFRLAHDALGLSNLARVDVSVYDLDPAVHGTFDFAFMGNILLHVSDPARAVESVRRVLAPDGHLLSLEPVSVPLTLLSRRRPLAQLFNLDAPRWWLPNRAGHRRLVEAGGFDVVESGGLVYQALGAWRPRLPPAVPRTWTELGFWGFVRPFGLPSAWVLARPRRRQAYRAVTITGVLEPTAVDDPAPEVGDGPAGAGAAQR